MKLGIVKNWIKQKLTGLLLNQGYAMVRRRPAVTLHGSRYEYQRRFVEFNIPEGGRVLDIGSGGDPFPYATVLVDRFLQQTKHRHEPLRRDARHFVVADIYSLPFRDKYFDFVYCSHLLEHVDDPIKACKEIIRVGKRGYIETPTFGKDALFAWAKGMHKWHVVSIANTLCFFEYTPRQLEGIRSTAWLDIIFSKWYHPLQDAFNGNPDVFNVMLTWEDLFTVFVFHLDGSTETLNTGNVAQNAFPDS